MEDPVTIAKITDSEFCDFQSGVDKQKNQLTLDLMQSDFAKWSG